MVPRRTHRGTAWPPVRGARGAGALKCQTLPIRQGACRLAEKAVPSGRCFGSQWSTAAISIQLSEPYRL